ncbi:hypothetical protein K438DRAFT_844550 [Mycena galopus ATCC 62051]|nr:hypothetical protein K438DRAFT_844550 [Mycena galopus ATCC 62051]
MLPCTIARCWICLAPPWASTRLRPSLGVSEAHPLRRQRLRGSDYTHRCSMAPPALRPTTRPSRYRSASCEPRRTSESILRRDPIFSSRSLKTNSCPFSSRVRAADASSPWTAASPPEAVASPAGRL